MLSQEIHSIKILFESQSEDEKGTYLGEDLSLTSDTNKAFIFRVTLLDDKHFYLSNIVGDEFLSSSLTLGVTPTIFSIENKRLFDGVNYITDVIKFIVVSKYDEPDIKPLKN